MAKIKFHQPGFRKLVLENPKKEYQPIIRAKIMYEGSIGLLLTNEVLAVSPDVKTSSQHLQVAQVNNR